MKRSRKSPKDTLGWREWVSFPSLGVDAVKAKVDTGARTSAIHAFDVKPFKRDGEVWLDFAIHPLQRDDSKVVRCSIPSVGQRFVKNSGGKMEKRYFIKTPVHVGGKTYPIELSLTSRDNMGFRMLLGRSALKGRFIVDSARSYLSDPRPRRKRKKKRQKVAKTDK